jgi:hypothetical protein
MWFIYRFAKKKCAQNRGAGFLLINYGCTAVIFIAEKGSF